MQKNIVLFSTTHSLLARLRDYIPSHWSLRVFTSVLSFHSFKPIKPPDILLLDSQLPYGFRQHIHSYLRAHPLLPYFYLSSCRLTSAGVHAAFHIPDDLPLLLAKLTRASYGHDTDICGNSVATDRLRRRLSAAARSATPVLLTGASGTGKTLAASVIHSLSARRNAEFYAVNVAAIPEYLAESELFGTVRGAFTDAERRCGYFAASNGGTLFLDEIGELSLAVQSKLLHVLESGMFRSVGSDVTQKADVRLIFATNLDLQRRVSQRLFRQDLYYRISRLVIHVPSLEERKEDIPILSRRYLAQYGKRLTSSAERLLCTLRWSGNVRQLHNCLERAVLYSKSDIIDVDDIVQEAAGNCIV